VETMPSTESEKVKSSPLSLEMAILAALTVVGGSMRAYNFGSPRTPVYDESKSSVLCTRIHI
jgi:hypothetical protein